MRVYLAGPMTGIPQFNFPAFDAAKAHLETLGSIEVVSPAELDDPIDRAAALASPDGSALGYGNGVKADYWDFIERDLRIIATDGIKAIIVLPGWEASRGARIETFVAHMHGMPIHGYPDLEPVPNLALYRAWTSDEGIHIYRNAFDHPVSATYVPRDGFRMGGKW